MNSLKKHSFIRISLLTIVMSLITYVLLEVFQLTLAKLSWPFLLPAMLISVLWAWYGFDLYDSVRNYRLCYEEYVYENILDDSLKRMRKMRKEKPSMTIEEQVDEIYRRSPEVFDRLAEI